MLMKSKTLPTFVAAALSAVALPAFAADLTMARGNEPQSIDPQFSRTGPTQMTAMHIFDRLVNPDRNSQPTPGLAESWKNIDPNTWEVKLRKGVKFHNGDAFDADDVVFSLNRAPNVPNSPASFAGYVKNLKSVEKVDAHTVKLISKKPDPLLVINVGNVFIVNKETTENAASKDFNSGKAAFGTGPYKFVSWTPGDKLVLKRNEGYWGKKPDFENVTMRFISNAAARVAALLSGSVDLADLVPPADIPKLKTDKKINVYTRPTGRLIYIALNQRKKGPFITDAKGGELDKNPLQNSKVRQAMSMMIDRKGIVDRILFGSGAPSGQLVPEGMHGYNPALTPPAYDLAGAKKLLKEAGYPNGFGVTVHCSNNRFLNDGEVAQALGQLFSRGGLTVNKVVTQPYSVYTKNAKKGKYGIFVFSYGNSTGEAGNGLSGLLHSYNKKAKQGTLNRARYKNKAFDAAIEKAQQEFDDAKRGKMLADAAKIAFDDAGIIPLYWQALTWASRKGIAYMPRLDERTLATEASVEK
jgi:peptide/nickel transport system substrate-binding protein